MNMPSLETLIKNMDNLYELAELLDCKIEVPASELKASFAHRLEKRSSDRKPKVGVPGAIGILPTPMDDPVTFLTLCAFDAAKNAVKLVKDNKAKKEAEIALIPIYKEIAAKAQAENLKLQREKQQLQKKLREEEQKNTENKREIQEQLRQVEKMEKLMKVFETMSAAG